MRSDGVDTNEKNQSKVQEESKDDDQNKLNERNMNSVNDESLSGEQDEVVSREANNSRISNDSSTFANINTDNVSNTHFGELAKESNVVTSNVNVKHAPYANSLTKGLNDGENKSFTILTSVNRKGKEVLLFDEELVMKGCEKKKLTCSFPTSSDVLPLPDEVPTARRKFPLPEEVPTGSAK
nr:hypothetical protein [Tanacetum cinerariifolium]